MNESEALIALATTPQLGNVRLLRLLNSFGTGKVVFTASAEEIASLPSFNLPLAKAILSWGAAAHWLPEYKLLQSLGAEIVVYGASNYPSHLLTISDPPPLLFVKGELIAADKRAIAIVGTRYATPYGLRQADLFSEFLSYNGFTVVSGLARGIDTAAHTAALRGGRTIAVLGSGLAAIYPKENSHLAEKISQKGALLTPFLLSTPPDRHLFPQRNRIVTGMTQATLLIEAPMKSGAMITADYALEQSRALFALPGRVDNESFCGNHSLIKEKKAILVEKPEEIVAFFEDLFGAPPLSKVGKAKAIKELDSLSSQEKQILAVLRQEEASLEILSRATAFPSELLQNLLMNLLLKKIIKELPGKIYQSLIHG